MLPEVVCLTHPYDTLGGYANLFCPDIVSLVILLVYAGPEKVRGNFESDREKFPRPEDSLSLEIIAEGEVTEHFKIGAVTCGLTYVVKVGSSDTLLAGSNSVTGRLLSALEVGLERCHTRVYKKQGVVILRNQRKAGETEMSLSLKV